MTVERDELRRLVDDLPDAEVPAAIEDVRRRISPPAATPWPPKWFGMGTGRRRDTAARSGEILAEGFGR